MDLRKRRSVLLSKHVHSGILPSHGTRVIKCQPKNDGGGGGETAGCIIKEVPFFTFDLFCASCKNSSRGTLISAGLTSGLSTSP